MYALNVYINEMFNSL